VGAGEGKSAEIQQLLLSLVSFNVIASLTKPHGPQSNISTSVQPRLLLILSLLFLLRCSLNGAVPISMHSNAWHLTCVPSILHSPPSLHSIVSRFDPKLQCLVKGQQCLEGWKIISSSCQPSAMCPALKRF